MTGKKKGDRRERDAVEIYNAAGYRCERAVQAHYGARSDWFELFDIMAMRPNDDFRFAQVKSNAARGVKDWMRRVHRLVPEGIECDFLVCHDNEGWRLLQVRDLPSSNREVVVDEREMDCAMGEGIAAWLSENDADA